MKLTVDLLNNRFWNNMIITSFVNVNLLFTYNIMYNKMLCWHKRIFTFFHHMVKIPCNSHLNWRRFVDKITESYGKNHRLNCETLHKLLWQLYNNMGIFCCWIKSRSKFGNWRGHNSMVLFAFVPTYEISTT